MVPVDQQQGSQYFARIVAVSGQHKTILDDYSCIAAIVVAVYQCLPNCCELC